MPARVVRAAALAMFLATPLSATPASAQEITLAQASEMMTAGNPDEVRMGIETLGVIGSPAAVEPIAARIRQGLPAELLSVAIDTLGLLGRREAGPVLFELTSHRRPEIRLGALNAIISIRPEGAAGALERALSDSDPRVRGVAATGLGEIGARGSVATLFHALDRGVLEASAPIGQLATPGQVQQLLGYVGRLPFDSVTPGLNEVIARSNVPNRTKLEVIGRLAELATPEVKTYLQEVVAALPDNPRDPVRRAAEDAILRIAD